VLALSSWLTLYDALFGLTVESLAFSPSSIGYPKPIDRWAFAGSACFRKLSLQNTKDCKGKNLFTIFKIFSDKLFSAKLNFSRELPMKKAPFSATPL
jgi:hypothetical protein